MESDQLAKGKLKEDLEAEYELNTGEDQLQH
jgi:hypothetical protein